MGGRTASKTWAAFEKAWVRYFGPAEVLITDGGSEFLEAFERGAKYLGIFQHVTNAESPWENGRCERHGGWIKDVVLKTAQEVCEGM